MYHIIYSNAAQPKLFGLSLPMLLAQMMFPETYNNNVGLGAKNGFLMVKSSTPMHCCYVWAIWKTRNSVCFEGGKNSESGYNLEGTQ